jgi:hypothetical protein
MSGAVGDAAALIDKDIRDCRGDTPAIWTY